MSAIKIEHLQKSYSGTPVLQDINLEVKPGDVIALLGHSGSGKSTLLRCLNGLELADKGQIAINGDQIEFPIFSDKAFQNIRKKVAFVFQQFYLWSHLTVLENIIEAPIHVLKKSKTQALEFAQQILQTVGLPDKAHAYPQQLSGGQQQRVAIARAIAMQPDIILLDEPTSALDPEMVAEVLAVIRKLAHHGTTLLLATHELNFAREVADQIIFLHQGKIIESGPPKQVFENPQTTIFKQFIASVYKEHA